MALFNLLSVNAQSLISFQKGIDITNKNINNVYNKDYARERPVFEELPIYGVNLANAHRIYDQRYFNRYINENQTLTYHKDLESNLSGLEAIFNDINKAGFADDINEYFSKINQIISEPDNMASRNDFLTTARKLLSHMKTSFNSLEDEKHNLFISFDKEAKEINRITSSLAKVNKALKGQVANTTLDQEKKNTLLNQRDKLLKELSSHIDSKVRYNSDGSADVFSVKGHTLVLGEKSFDIALKDKQINLPSGITTTTKRVTINGIDLTDEFQKGTLGAKIEYQNTLTQTMDKLNTFAMTFAQKNNSIHNGGYGLDDSTGIDLFTGASIKDLTVNQTLIDNPEKIAASSNLGEDSNNENMKILYALKEQTFSDLDNKTFYNYYIDLVGSLANKKDFHAKMAVESQMVVESIESKLEDISGVNIDEELMNLMQLQHSYQAAAKVINVTDELLQTIMGLVR